MIIPLLSITVSYATAYFIGPEAVSYDEAEAYCITQGAHLATITSEMERKESKDLCQLNDDDTGNGCWIGLYYDDTTSSYKWQDGSALGYGFSDGNATQGIVPWYPGEPSCYYQEYCIQIYDQQGYSWNDATCDALNFPLCNDQIEMTYFKGTVNGDYNDASAYCESQGTTLASITTQTEWNNAKDICGDDGCWIGLRDDLDGTGNSEGKYSFDDGSNIGTSYGFNVDRTATTGQGPWSINEPNEFRGAQEDCVFMYAGTGKYNDAVCGYNSDGLASIYPLCNKPTPKTYIKGPDPLRRSDAADYCNTQNGETLASIVTEAEWNNARDVCGSNDCWIGLQDDLNGVDMIWEWDDGSDITISYGFNANSMATTGIIPWYHNEPNEARGRHEDCVIMYANHGRYNDAQCYYEYYPLCNKVGCTADNDCGNNAGCDISSGECICDTGFDGNPNILCRPLTCPDGYEQVGPINADIDGCGLNGCDGRYTDSFASMDECIAGCEAEPECLSITWAPLGGDKTRPYTTVCTLYKKFYFGFKKGPNQILCRSLSKLQELYQGGNHHHNIAEAQSNDKIVDGNDHSITNGANANESQNRIFIIIGCIASALCILCMIFGIYLYRKKNKGYSIHKYVTKTEDEDMDDIIDGDGDDEDIEMTTCNNDLVDEETQMNIE